MGTTATDKPAEEKREKIWSILENKLGMNYGSILKSIAFHLEYTLGKERYTANDRDFAESICYAVKDRLMERWNDTQSTYYKHNVKRVYYLSLEYLMGRTLTNSLINLGIYNETKKIFKDIGYDINELLDYENDAGLGNGGLGRLAACFMDSMATMHIPAYSYGLRYEYGIFKQEIKDGYQLEEPDLWLDSGSPWETARKDYAFEVNFYGEVRTAPDKGGNLKKEWIDTEKIYAVAYDYPVPGFQNKTANSLRLWSARATEEFNLDYFNSGNYMKAVEDKILSENITMVLYPRDDEFRGKELRLKQEYFFTSATLQDIIRRHKIINPSLDNLPDKAAIQMNDTHPAIAITEMMRLLIDIYGYEWEKAWEMTTKIFAYTNHSVMPEAMEKWPEDLLGHLLPRHLEIIYEINNRLIDQIKKKYPGDDSKIAKMSIIDERENTKLIRMAHLAIAGSHSVNGVAELHTKILKEKIFKEFDELYPGKFNNKTNGITPRRWLKLCNSLLSELITKHIGSGWTIKLEELKKLENFALDEDFQNNWLDVKYKNKKRLAEYIEKNNKIKVNINSIFDCQVKRIHEYKRQLLNLLHVIYLYNRIRKNSGEDFVPRTVIFGGKAAPGYFMAKLIIKLINSVADVINNDPLVKDKLKVVFLEDYNVSVAELVFPAADLSEQISTAGLEASGTGNMKFALNGALTIGTLDGANIEIMEAVGGENIFIFGLSASEVEKTKAGGYNPRNEYNLNPDLKECVDMIANGYFSAGDKHIFEPVVYYLLDGGDCFIVMKDFNSYVEMQKKVSKAYLDKKMWVKSSIINTANMGKFSSDRAIAEYAEDIWKVNPVCVDSRKSKNATPDCAEEEDRI